MNKAAFPVLVALLMTFVVSSADAKTVLKAFEIISSSGDGMDNMLGGTSGIAVEGSDDSGLPSFTYVTGFDTNNAFRITSTAKVKIIDTTGDGMGNKLNGPRYVTIDGLGNAYVVGSMSHNAFKVTPDGEVTEIIDQEGDRTGENPLQQPSGIAVDQFDNIYVTGYESDNVFKVTPDGVVSELIDGSGDGSGNMLNGPRYIGVKGCTVYVTGELSSNAFKISDACLSGGISNNTFRNRSNGPITEIIDDLGDGMGNALDKPWGIAADAADNVYVAGKGSNNVFKITPGGVITQIIDVRGDGRDSPLGAPGPVAVDLLGNVYVSGETSNNAFKITPSGVIRQVIDATGAGAGKLLSAPDGIAVDESQLIYVAGSGSDNAFVIKSFLKIFQDGFESGDTSAWSVTIP